MANALVVVTGHEDIDRKLVTFEKRLQRKVLAQAGRKSADEVLADFRRRVPVDSGAMRAAAKRKAIKRTRTAIGSQVIIDRDKLVAEYTARVGRPPGKRLNDKEPFFYPAIVELGGAGFPARKPMREALYGNAEAIKRHYMDHLRKAINAAGRP